MAIDLLHVLDSNREIIGIIDTAKSVIWHTVWFGVGDFEIYAPATADHLQLLSIGNYITRSDDVEVGIIESISVTNSIIDGAMVTATGRFAKSILDRRLIYNLTGNSNKATVLRGKVENAARSLVANNAISCGFDSRRNFPLLELGALKNIPDVIVDDAGYAAEKQVSYQNLLEYSDGLLEEYGLSSLVILNDDTKKLQYVVRKGTDRSSENTNGLEPVIFSRDYDNLSDSEYYYSTEEKKNAALIGGEGEGLGRFYSLIAPNETGLERREIFVDAASITKKYMDGETEREYTDSEYTAMLNTQGMQELAPLTEKESFSGTIIVTDGNYILNEDFSLGDVVTVQENSINKFINVRIVEVTEVQDENGYTVDVVYQ